MDMLKNPIVKYEGNEISLFDLTEEKDAQEAFDLIKAVL
jgi:hypothetical protein